MAASSSSSRAPTMGASTCNEDKQDFLLPGLPNDVVRTNIIELLEVDLDLPDMLSLRAISRGWRNAMSSTSAWKVYTDMKEKLRDMKYSPELKKGLYFMNLMKALDISPLLDPDEIWTCASAYAYAESVSPLLDPEDTWACADAYAYAESDNQIQLNFRYHMDRLEGIPVDYMTELTHSCPLCTCAVAEFFQSAMGL